MASSCLSELCAGSCKAGAVHEHRDGFLDLAYVSPPFVGVNLGNGNGGFGPPVSVDSTSMPAVVVAGDVDGDGKVE